MRCRSGEGACFPGETEHKKERIKMEIYVGNLAYATTDDGLKAAFAQFGEVTAVRVEIGRAHV